MKVLAAGLLVAAALTVTGAAAPQLSTCCHEAPVSDFDPQWSGDGSRIAFVRQAFDGLSALFTILAAIGDRRPD